RRGTDGTIRASLGRGSVRTTPPFDPFGPRHAPPQIGQARAQGGIRFDARPAVDELDRGHVEATPKRQDEDRPLRIGELVRPADLLERELDAPAHVLERRDERIRTEVRRGELNDDALTTEADGRKLDADVSPVRRAREQIDQFAFEETLDALGGVIEVVAQPRDPGPLRVPELAEEFWDGPRVETGTEQAAHRFA